MTLRSVTYLKGVFETGDIPTGTDYSDIFDSFVSLHSSAAQTMQGSLTLPGVTTSSLNMNGPMIRSYTSANGNGTTQGAASLIPSDVGFLNVVTSANRAFRITNYQLGRVQYISTHNISTTAASIFPASGCNFLGTAANAPLLLQASRTMLVIHIDASSYAFARF